MLTDEQLHHQVKVIETQLSRAQAAASRGDIPKCQLHMTFALAEFMSTMGAVHNVPIGAFGRHSMGISGEADNARAKAVEAVESAVRAKEFEAMAENQVVYEPVGAIHPDKPIAWPGVEGRAIVDKEQMKADLSAPEPLAPVQTPQTSPVRQSLRWEHVPDDFGGKMRLFIGAFDIIGIQQDEDDNERAFYYPTTGWYHLENIVYHPPSQYHNRVEQIDELMRTAEQAMRWTEEQLKLPILPTWIDGEQVTMEAAP